MALSINKNQYNEKAEIVREKGTNRKKFLIGEVDKYTWEDLGSSYLPSELISSFLPSVVLFPVISNSISISLSISFAFVSNNETS